MKIKVLLSSSDIRELIQQKLFESLPDEVLNPDNTEIECYWKDENEQVYLSLQSLQIVAKLETYSIEGDKI